MKRVYKKCRKNIAFCTNVCYYRQVRIKKDVFPKEVLFMNNVTNDYIMANPGLPKEEKEKLYEIITEEKNKRKE